MNIESHWLLRVGRVATTVAALAFLAACNEAVSVERQRAVLSAPAYDGAFWTTWGVGRAELAGYDLTMPRYGELR